MGGACCEADTDTCGGFAAANLCNGDAAMTAGGKDAAWKAKSIKDIKTNGDKRKAACCVARAKCSQGTPKAGYKLKPGVEATLCKNDDVFPDGDVAACGSDETNCVVKDDKK